MSDFPKQGFSSADPDDEIDLEALVKKTPAPQPPKKIEGLSSKPAVPATKPPTQGLSISKIKEAPVESYAADAETEFDHAVPRNKVRILPEFPTLILIIIVSLLTAVITGLIVRLSVPSLQSKVQEVLSNEENTSVKVNDIEQSVSKLMDDMKALQEKAKAQQASPAPAKKHKATPKAQKETEGASPAPEGAGTE
jgi:cell division protein FtsB